MSGRTDGALRTLARGLRLSPELRDGLAGTLALAVVGTAGRVVVPVAIQLTLDRGLLAPGGARPDLVARYALAALLAVVVTATAGRMSTFRLIQATERALSGLRVRAFRHIHDLSLAHHTAEHRGSLVARVTADVDTISQFMSWGGAMLVVSVGQLLVATVVMALYSVPLTLLVLACVAPLAGVLRFFQRRLGRAYDRVRERVGQLLVSVSESVMGAPEIRAYGLQERANRRVADAVARHFDAAYRAARVAALMFTSGEVFASLALAVTVVAGVLLGVDGAGLSPGRLVAFLFLVNLFVGPVQVSTEILDHAQTAIAGWRRVLGVLDVPADVADPVDGRDIPPGPVGVRFEHVNFRYGPDKPGVLHDVDVELRPQTRVAVVGETGSGKTTFAKLLTRLMDPTGGRVLVNGMPLDRVAFASLRRRMVMVPQDDFLFDASIADNVGYGRPSASRTDIALAFTELGLADWLEGLPDGLDTRVGERGGSLSVGERQLVALTRAYLANPDLLVLDEATSAVDPATQVRLQRALDSLARGRTALTIAHRLSTAETADEVWVFDAGRIVARGHHADLVDRPGVYRSLYAEWASTSRPDSEAIA